MIMLFMINTHICGINNFIDKNSKINHPIIK